MLITEIVSIFQLGERAKERRTLKILAMNINSTKVGPIFNHCSRGDVVIASDFKSGIEGSNPTEGRYTIFSSDSFSFFITFLYTWLLFYKIDTIFLTSTIHSTLCQIARLSTSIVVTLLSKFLDFKAFPLLALIV